MATHLEFAIFTVLPSLVMSVTVVYSLIKVYELNDRRPLLLVALLLLMIFHQFVEVGRFNSGIYYQTTSVSAEVFESGANLLASVGSYFVLQQITDLRTTRTELEASNAALQERSSMVSVLDRVLRHNVRNDVNIITSQAAYIQEHSAGDQFDEELEKIEEAAWRLATISDRTQRIRQLLVEDSAGATTLDLSECLAPPIERIEDNAPDASITLDHTSDGELTIEGPATFPTALADVIEQIVASNDGSVDVDITVTREQLPDGQGREQVTIVIDDDREGLPELDIRAVENEEETPLKHADGLSLWCLKWAVTRAGGELDPHTETATIEIRLPQTG